MLLMEPVGLGLADFFRISSLKTRVNMGFESWEIV
jgi:hypothetical protein